MENEEKLYDSIDEYIKDKKYKCVYCRKEIKDLEKGCVDCNNKTDFKRINSNPRLERISKEYNFISSVLKYVAKITLFLGIADIILGLIRDNYEVKPIFLLYELIFILVIFGIGEIIEILHDIRFKVWKK